MKNIFYISDTHFSHEAVVRMDRRPFENAKDMNEKMLENWNSVVGKQDLVYVLGDFLWKFRDEDFSLVKQLNGRKRLIKGNHDKTHSKNFKNLFESIMDYEKIKDGEHTVVLSHYPHLAYDGSYKGRNLHFYGHVHENTVEAVMVNKFILESKTEELPMKMYNVGAMMSYMDYTPRTLEEIVEGSKGVVKNE